MFSALENSIRQLIFLDKSLVSKDLVVNDVVSFDNYLATTQPLLSDEETLGDLWNKFEKDQVKVDQESHLSKIMEKPSSALALETIHILMTFVILTGSTELQAPKVKASKSLEI